jgi:hypothetical protein
MFIFHFNDVFIFKFGFKDMLWGQRSLRVKNSGIFVGDMPTLALHEINEVLPGIATSWTRNPLEEWWLFRQDYQLMGEEST